MQSTDSIGRYAYGMNKDLVFKKEEIKCNNIIKLRKTFNFDYIIKEGIKAKSFYWILKWCGWHKNIEEYNLNTKRKMLIVFEDKITEMLSDKILNPTVIGLFIREKN